MKAFCITADSTTDIIDIEDSTEAFRQAVGGYVELIGLFSLPGRLTHAYIDDEGKLKRKSINHMASAVAHQFGTIHEHDMIYGTMIILEDDGEGGEADITEEPLRVLRSFLGVST